MQIEFIKLYASSLAPTKANKHDAAYDLYVQDTKVLVPDKLYLVNTGIAVNIPKGYVGLLFPRSSIYKTELRLSNSVGVIDHGYQDEIKMVFDDIIEEPIGFSAISIQPKYLYGQRCGQLLIIPKPDITFTEVQQFSTDYNRGGGFGSSGQ